MSMEYKSVVIPDDSAIIYDFIETAMKEVPEIRIICCDDTRDQFPGWHFVVAEIPIDVLERYTRFFTNFAKKHNFDPATSILILDNKEGTLDGLIDYLVPESVIWVKPPNTIH